MSIVTNDIDTHVAHQHQTRTSFVCVKMSLLLGHTLLLCLRVSPMGPITPVKGWKFGEVFIQHCTYLYPPSTPITHVIIGLWGHYNVGYILYMDKLEKPISSHSMILILLSYPWGHPTCRTSRSRTSFPNPSGSPRIWWTQFRPIPSVSSRAFGLIQSVTMGPGFFWVYLGPVDDDG